MTTRYRSSKPRPVDGRLLPRTRIRLGQAASGHRVGQATAEQTLEIAAEQIVRSCECSRSMPGHVVRTAATGAQADQGPTEIAHADLTGEEARSAVKTSRTANDAAVAVVTNGGGAVRLSNGPMPNSKRRGQPRHSTGLLRQRQK